MICLQPAIFLLAGQIFGGDTAYLHYEGGVHLQTIDLAQHQIPASARTWQWMLQQSFLATRVSMQEPWPYGCSCLSARFQVSRKSLGYGWQSVGLLSIRTNTGKTPSLNLYPSQIRKNKCPQKCIYCRIFLGLYTVKLPSRWDVCRFQEVFTSRVFKTPGHTIYQHPATTLARVGCSRW